MGTLTMPWSIRLIEVLICVALCTSGATACGGATGDDDGGGEGDGDDCVGRDGDVRTGTGCPCEGGAVACYTGPPGTAGNGSCRAGLRVCDGRTWGECEGQSLPRADVEISCDGIDEDCDGETDDGVKGRCGCADECSSLCLGVGCAEPFREKEGRSLVMNPDGSITPFRRPAPQSVIWIPNTGEGTISRVDTRTREEDGRYLTMPQGIALGEEASPSYVTVNLQGDAVVSNRERTVGGATKILGGECPDRSGNGQIDTSQNGGDILPWGEDECVAWYASDIPAAHGGAFELRPEQDGGLDEYVWVASYSLDNRTGGTIFELDSLEGEKTGREVEDTPGYAVAMAPEGILWTVGLDECPRATDTTTLEQTSYLACGSARGLAIDAVGRPWISDSASRLDLDNEVWERPVDGNGNPFAIPGGSGIAVDASGNAYTGRFGEAYRIDGKSLEVTALPGMGGQGWSVDVDGFVWAVDADQDAAFVMDPRTFAVTTVRPPFVAPFTYSSNLTIVGAPVGGDYTHTFETCPATQELQMLSLAWDAAFPEDSTLAFRIKHGETLEVLEDRAWIAVGTAPEASTPVDLDEVLTIAGEDLNHVGRYVAVEATLHGPDGHEGPTLRSLTLAFTCHQP